MAFPLQLSLSFIMYTVRSFNNNGPYFPATRDVYQAASLKDFIFHVRQCMEDNEYMIGLFDDNGQCKGIWEDCAEAMSDGEGGMVLEKPSYVLHRPGSLSDGMWSLMVNKFKRAQ